MNERGARKLGLSFHGFLNHPLDNFTSRVRTYLREIEKAKIRNKKLKGKLQWNESFMEMSYHQSWLICA